MGTKLYLKNTIASEGPIAHYMTYSGDIIHNWPDTTAIFAMETTSNSSEVSVGDAFLAYPVPHDSHVRTFVSGRLNYGENFTGNSYTFAAKMGKSNVHIDYENWYDEETGEHHIIPVATQSTVVNPQLFMYIWTPSGSVRATLSDASLSMLDYNVNKYYTYSSIALNPKLALKGDRLVLEVHYHQVNPEGWSGNSAELFAFNDANSYISFSNAFDFTEVRSKTNKSVYHMRNRTAPKSRRFPYVNYANYRTSSARRFPYKILTPIYTISNESEFVYDFFSYRYITLYAETESTARGRVSLNMTPRASISFNTYFDDYAQKWVFPEPTLHKFIMIDDFEGYDALSDMALNWTISDGLVTFSAIKTFSAINMEDYDVMTIYAMGSLPTALQAQFGDKYGNSSSVIPFLITDRWERYEQSVSWGDCNPQVITSVKFDSEYNSSITLDDIFMLNHNPVTENTDWMKMNLTDIDLNRGQKMATFKIPFKQQEMIQFSGDKNGEGELRIRSIDTMQTSFLDECLKRNTPLYFRYKNMGLPIVIRSSNRDFKQIIPKEVSSEVSIPFYEIYDYSKF